MTTETDLNPTAGSKHPWKFFRAGGFDQVRLDTGADLLALEQLDQKLWAALSCPVRGLEFDTRTLELIDTDKDGHIRVPEILAAVKWAGAMLKNADDLTRGGEVLPLAAINDASPEGRDLAAAARHILATLGKAGTATISVEDTADTAKIFAETQFNGDGIIPIESATDAATKALITDIIACAGAENDRSGKPGISQAKVDQFFTDAQAHLDWWKGAERDAANVLPLGDATHAAATALKAVRGKVDDYFTRTRLATFDARALTALNRVETDYLAVTIKDLSAGGAELAGFPLARIEAGRPLPLVAGLNPAWADAVAVFKATVVTPILGERAELTADEWLALKGKFTAYEAWLALKAGEAAEKLGIGRIGEILAGEGKALVSALIARDKALEAEFNAIASVDRLIRYHRDLYTLLNNFVSFRDFYTRSEKAVFQAGTLYLDQRSCDLCVRVDDPGRHGALAGLSKTYLAYCDCTRAGAAGKLTIAAAFTNGDADNLMVGRNGVFYDRQGQDWEATITKIVENPISIRQAFWSPYKRFIRMIEEQVAKRAAAAESASDAELAATAAMTSNLDKTKPAAKKLDIGTVAALGVALGSLATALGMVFAKFVELPLWKVPFAVLGIMLAISMPSMLIAWLKLRQRNLGPILDANGWAINSRARINLPFGASLTAVAKLPPNAQRDLVDPFADAKRPWRTWLTIIFLLILVISWVLGRLDDYLPGGAKSISVMGTNAPAYKAPPVAPAAPTANTTTNKTQ